MFRKRQKGFTLVELLVVMAIIAILASIVVPNVAKYIRKSRMTRALAEIKSIELALTNMLADADRSSLHQLFNPEKVREKIIDMSNINSAIGLYTNAFYALLRTGRAAITDQDPDIAEILDTNVVSRLGTSYLADLRRDPWGNLYQIYPGPWPGRRMAGGVDINPPIFRTYQVPSNEQNLPGSGGAARVDTLTFAQRYDGDYRVIDEVTGQQIDIGFPAPRDMLAFIWSYGENMISGQAIYQNTGYTGDPSQYYSQEQDLIYMGGGDDINNWDSGRSWERLYN